MVQTLSLQSNKAKERIDGGETERERGGRNVRLSYEKRKIRE
jgi:hypothetical protein